MDDKGNRYTTEVRYVNGLFTWVAVGITCLVAGIYTVTYYSVTVFHPDILVCVWGGGKVWGEWHVYSKLIFRWSFKIQGGQMPPSPQ